MSETRQRQEQVCGYKELNIRCLTRKLTLGYCDNMDHWYSECMKCEECGQEYHSVRRYPKEKVR